MRSTNATLVVIEFGGAWPGWLSPSDLGNIAVIAQHYEGHPASLITQVESRLARLVAMDWRIDDIVLVSNGRTDLEALSARAELTRNLLSYLCESAGVRLVFSVASTLGRRACHSLMALASGLQDRALAHGITLVVRHGELEPVYSRPRPKTLVRAS